MDTKLDRDLKRIEDDFFYDEFPIGAIGIVLMSIVITAVFGYTYNWHEMNKFQMFENGFILVGVAVYLGRQCFDWPLIYLILSKGERYKSIDEKKKISYVLTKHSYRAVFLVLLIGGLYFWNEKMNIFSFVTILLTFGLLPLIYRIFASRKESKVRENLKKKPVERISSDGKVDLTSLPFVFENLDKYDKLSGNVKNSYVEIQSLLDYVTGRISYIEDPEVAHVLKRMGEEELPRLLKEYSELETEIQREYEEKTLSYLSLIKDELLLYKTKINEQKTKNIKTTFSILDERYQKPKA